MNNLIKNTRKAFLTLAIVLATTASSFGQLYWSGLQTLQPGQVINDNIILTGNVTLELASGLATINGSISGGFSVTKTGVGTLILTSPNNSYSGATNINGGYIQLSNGGNLTNTIGVIINSGWLEFINQSNPIFFTRVISGAGGVALTSCNKVTLTATNTYTGLTDIYNAILQVGNGAVGSISNTIGVFLTNANSVIRFEPGAMMIFDKSISGYGGRLEYKGDDTKRLLLTAANTLGTTTVESGRFEIHGSHTGNITLQGNSMVVFNHSSPYTYSGIISGTGSVHKTGAGTLTLNGVNTFSGGMIVWNGPLALGASGTIENTGVNLADGGAKLNISTGNKRIKGLDGHSSSEVVLGNSRLFLGTEGSNDGGGAFAGRFTGAGGIDKRGSATLNLYGTSTHSGYNDLQAGTILFSSLANFGSAGIFLYGGTLAWNTGITVDISSRIGMISNGANVTFDTRANNVTFATALPTTTANITKAGTGKLTLTAANTYSGTTTVSGGTLQIGNGTSGSINNTASISVAQGAVIRFEPGDHLNLNKVVSGAGSLEYRGSVSKSLRLNAANTYTGRTFNEFGDLYIGDGPTGSVAGNIENNSTLYFARTNDYTYSGVISGTGSLYIIGGGKTTLTGVNTYTGLTSINNGTLQIGNGSSGSINSTSAVNVVNSNCVLRFEPGEITTFSKVISGAGRVEYKGIADQIGLTFTADNTYTGTTTIEAGDLNLGYGTATGSVSGNIINNGRWLFFRRTNNLTYSGIISGTGGIAQAGTPILTLNGANTYSGETHIRSTIVLGASGSIENSSRVRFIVESTKLDVTAGNKKIKGLHTDDIFPNAEVALGSSILTIGTAGQSDGSGNFSGKFTGTGGVTKTGTGILTVSGANTATGVFRQEAGTVAFSSIWKGNYNKLSGAAMTIIGNPEIEGNFMLAGGDINMDLTQATPSKLVVMGAVSASGNNILNITSDEEVTNQLLIQSFSGISTEPFSVNMPGFDAVLTAPGGNQLLLTATISVDFIPVSEIIDLPTEATAGDPLLLSGTVLPSDASYQTITFIVQDAGTTGATITDNTLNTTDEGIVVVLATIVNGLAIGEDYTQTFTVTVHARFIPVLYIYNIPNEATVGTPLLLTGAVEPSNATNQTIVFSVLDEGTTGATITDNTLNTTDEGIVVVLATIANGLAMGEDYTQEFTISVDIVFVPVYYITNIPDVATVGTPLLLTGTVEPSNATNQTIIFSVLDAGITGATITDNTLYTTDKGMIIVLATIINGLAISEDYTLDYTIWAVTSGVNQLGIRNNELRVYPNPTKGVLFVETGHALSYQTIELLDISGRNVETWRAASLQNGTINISHLPASIYFLRIDGQTIKVVKE